MIALFLWLAGGGGDRIILGNFWRVVLRFDGSEERPVFSLPVIKDLRRFVEVEVRDEVINCKLLKLSYKPARGTKLQILLTSPPSQY